MIWFSCIINLFSFKSKIGLQLRIEFWLVFGRFSISSRSEVMSRAKPSWKSFNSARTHHYYLHIFYKIEIRAAELWKEVENQFVRKTARTGMCVLKWMAFLNGQKLISSLYCCSLTNYCSFPGQYSTQRNTYTVNTVNDDNPKWC